MGYFYLLKLVGKILLIGLGSFLYWIGLLRGISDGFKGVLTFFLLVGSLVLPFLCCVGNMRTRKESSIDFFQPGLVVAVFFYIYIWIPAFQLWYFLDYSSNWVDFFSYEQKDIFNHSLFLANLGLIGFGLGYRSLSKYRTASRGHKRFVSVSGSHRLFQNSYINVFSFFLIFTGIVANFGMVSRLGGVSQTLLEYLSPSLFYASGITVPGFLDFLTSFLTWGALLFSYFHVVRGKNEKITLVILGILFVIQYFIVGGKRSYVAPLLILPLIWHHYVKKAITMRQGFLLLLVGFVLMAVLLLMRIVVPLLTVGGSTYENAARGILDSPWKSYFNEPDLAIFDVMMLCVKYRESIIAEVGGWLNAFNTYNVLPIVYLMPRYLWEDKPAFQDIGQTIYNLYIGSEPQVGFSVGIFGASYILGGTIGTFITMFVVGMICKAIYSCFRPVEGHPNFVFGYSVFIWVLFMFLRFGTVGYTFLFVVHKILIGIIISLSLVYSYYSGKEKGRKLLGERTWDYRRKD